MIFIHKPTVLIHHEEISYVECNRISNLNNQRSFDFKVVTKSGAYYEFRGVENVEFNNIMNYFNVKKMKVKVNDGDNVMDVDEEQLPVVTQGMRKAPNKMYDIPSGCFLSRRGRG